MANLPNPTVSDARLADVLDILDRGFLEVVSFDVFDTLLWRKVHEPVDAFLLLGHELLRTGVLRPSMTPEVFALLRRRAEKLARKKHPNPAAPEVTLTEIYACASPKAFGGRSAADLAELEARFERTVTFPDLDIAAVARLAAEKSLHMVLVSDTYFSSDQLRMLLDRPPFEGLTFDVFTSSEHRTGKGQGLFKVVLDKVGASPEKVLHIGDHPESDVTAPAKLGIRTAHYHKFPGPLAQVVDREIGVREGHIYRKRPRIDPVLGDFGLTAVRAKVGTQYPSFGIEPDLVPYWQLGATVLGPVFSGYSEWVHERAVNEGVREVYCLMREGEFLSRMINATGKRIDSPVIAKPLWASRRVCAEASILRADEEELLAFVARRKIPNVREYCSSIGLDVAALPDFTQRAQRRLDDKTLRTELVTRIAEDDELRNQVLAWSAAKRKRFLAHLQGAVDVATGTVVLADLGWGATIQWHIDKALSDEGVGVETVGLYLLSGKAAVDRMLDGLRVEGFIASANSPEHVAAWVTRSPEVLEQVCMSDTGSLIGFSDDGRTLHAPSTENATQSRQRRAVQNGALCFDAFWGRYEPLLTQRPVLGDVARPALEAILLRLIVEPTESEARLLAHWLHDENFGSESSESIVDEELARFAGHMTPTQFLNLPMTRVYWPFGLAALHNPPLAVAAGTVAADIAPAGAFESAEALPVIIEIDEGVGFSEFRRLEGRSNVNGLRFVRTEFLESTRAMRLVFGERPAVLRLDGLRLVLVLDDGRVEKVDLPATAGFDVLSVDRGIQLSGNVIIGTHAGPALSYRLPAHEPNAFRVEVEVAFCILPIESVGRPREIGQQLFMKAARRAVRRLAATARRG